VIVMSTEERQLAAETDVLNGYIRFLDRGGYRLDMTMEEAQKAIRIGAPIRVVDTERSDDLWRRAVRGDLEARREVIANRTSKAEVDAMFGTLKHDVKLQEDGSFFDDIPF
jgi:hypothetical protein